jgi:hypothetical protein
MKAYLNDGRLEIDNNLVENEIRPGAIGKEAFSSSALEKPESKAPSSTPSQSAPAAWVAEQKRRRTSAVNLSPVKPAPAAGA